MAEDAYHEKDLIDFELGSKSFRKKGNALMAAVRKLINDKKKEKRTPLVLYLETDSVPVAVEIDATVMDSALLGGSNPEIVE